MLHRPLRWWRAQTRSARARCLAFCAAALALIGAVGIPIGSARPGPDLVLIDLSRSHWSDDESAVRRALVAGFEARLGDGDLEVVGFAGEVRALARAPRGSSASDLADETLRRVRELRDGLRAGSDLDAALIQLSGRQPPFARAWLFGDGRYEESAFEPDFPIEHLGRVGPPPPDLRIAWLRPPAPGVAGRPSDLAVRVTSTALDDRDVVLKVGTLRLEGRVAAEGREEFRVRSMPSADGFRAELLAVDGPDAHAANDRVFWPLRGAEQARVVLWGSGAGDLAPLFDPAEFTVEIAGARPALPEADLFVLTEPELDGQAARLDALAGAVRVRASGLLLLGGPRAFRGAGWAGTALGRLSPLDPRPQTAAELHLLLDVSGSMHSGESLARARTAITTLAQGLAPEVRLQVWPSAGEVQAAIPAQPVPAKDFALRAAGPLAALQAGGSTRLFDALATICAAQPAAGQEQRGLIVLSDFEDESWGDAAAAGALRERLGQRFGAGTVGVLLQPLDATRKRARTVLDHLHEAPRGIVPRLLIESVAKSPFEMEATPVRWLAAVPQLDAATEISELGAWNRTQLAAGAKAWLETDAAIPLLASWRHGAGQVFALGVDPRREAQAAALLPGLARAAARRAAGWRAEWSGGRLRVEAPDAHSLPVGPLVWRTEAGDQPLDEVAPGCFEVQAAARQATAGVVAVQNGEEIAALTVGGGEDPEYEHPAGRWPSRGSAEGQPSPRRHRTLPLLISLIAALAACGAHANDARAAAKNSTVSKAARR